MCGAQVTGGPTGGYKAVELTGLVIVSVKIFEAVIEIATERLRVIRAVRAILGLAAWVFVRAKMAYEKMVVEPCYNTAPDPNFLCIVGRMHPLLVRSFGSCIPVLLSSNRFDPFPNSRACPGSSL
ncbi:unnamed protein product [Discula destructiva]